MFKSLLVSLSILALAACGSSDSSSSTIGTPAGGTVAASTTTGTVATGSSSSTTASADSSSSSNTPAPVAASSDEQCAYGTYRMITNFDNDEHFRMTLEPNGIVRYNLRDGPSRRWSRSGNNITFAVPDGSRDVTLTWGISRTSSDCTVLELRGKAFDGSTDMTGFRV